MTRDPHRDQPVLTAGRKLGEAAFTAEELPPETFSNYETNSIILSLRTLRRRPPRTPGIHIHSSRRLSRTSPG